MSIAHVQAGGHERTTILLLLHWNRVSKFCYPQNLTPPENAMAIYVAEV